LPSCEKQTDLIPIYKSPLIVKYDSIPSGVTFQTQIYGSNPIYPVTTMFPNTSKQRISSLCSMKNSYLLVLGSKTIPTAAVWYTNLPSGKYLILFLESWHL